MRLVKYIFAAACVSGGIFLWSTGNPLLFPFGTMLVCAQSLVLLGKTELLKPIRFRKPEWKPKEFFASISILLCAVLFVVLLTQLPQDQARDLFTRWYFSGTLWLLCMSMLAKRYVDDREKAQQSDRGATSKTAPSTASEASHP